MSCWHFGLPCRALLGPPRGDGAQEHAKNDKQRFRNNTRWYGYGGSIHAALQFYIAEAMLKQNRNEKFSLLIDCIRTKTYCRT